LIARVRELPAYTTADWPLRLQISVNDMIARVPGETVVSVLSMAVFVVACLMTARMFTVVRFDRP
jgi:hypothetical protein